MHEAPDGEGEAPGSSPADGAPAPRGDARVPTTLRSCARAHGASVAEYECRAPTNLAVNHHDGGHDFDVSYTLSLTFASLEALGCFLAAAGSLLEPWLHDRSGRALDLCVGAARMELAGWRDLELVLALLGEATTDEPASTRPEP